jgi:hypothetical protein
MKTFTNLKIVRQITTYGVFITFVMFILICAFQLKSQTTQMQTITLDRSGLNYIISENNDKQHNFLVQHNTPAPYINCTQVAGPQTEKNDTLIKSICMNLDYEIQPSFPDFFLYQLNDYRVSKKHFADQPVSAKVNTKNYKITFTNNCISQVKGFAEKTVDDNKNYQANLKITLKYLREYNKIEKFSDNESFNDDSKNYQANSKINRKYLRTYNKIEKFSDIESLVSY